MEEFEKQIINVMNASPLPLEAKLYVMKHVYGLAENEYKRLLTEKEHDNGGSDRADR